MSEKGLPEISYDEHPGFKSALFLNMSDYHPNCLSPKNDINSIESCRLSIESLTPGTTPKGTEKRKCDSNFRFCLSKDLLQRLEESSPFNHYGERNGQTSDVCLTGCEDITEEGGKCAEIFEEVQRRSILGKINMGNTADIGTHFTPSTFPSDHSLLESSNVNDHHNYHNNDHNEQEGSYIQDEVARKLNFNKENEPSFSFNVPLGNFSSSFAGQMGVFSSFGKGVSNLYNINQTYYMGQVNNPNNKNFDSACKGSNGFNKFSHIPFNFNSDCKNGGKGYINLMTPTVNGFINSGVTGGAVSGLSNVSALNLSKASSATANPSINMYGKNGWICAYCKNFNYEIRVKCNRCSKCRNEITNTNNSKNAVVIMNTIGKTNSDGPNSPLMTSTAASASTGKKKKPFVERVGDWNCFKCKNLNFSFRVNCNRCQLSKKESEKLNEQSSKGVLSVGSNVSNNSVSSTSSGESLTEEPLMC